jgi:hypothetical protein
LGYIVHLYQSNIFSTAVLLTSADFFLQADAETDEVYAQMTLQPLSPVREDFLVFSIHICMLLFSLTKEFFLARAQGLISTSRLRRSQQATNKLLLQNVNCK